MSVVRVILALLTALVVGGFDAYMPYIRLNPFWSQEVQLLRLVVLGAVMCGLAVTGGKASPKPVKPRTRLRLKNGPFEADPGLEAMARAFRDRREPANEREEKDGAAA